MGFFSILLGALVASVVASGCSGAFFYPKTGLEPVSLPPDVRKTDLWLDRPGEPRLHGWQLEPADRPIRGTVVFFHGNADNLAGHRGPMVWLAREGYRVVAFDYRGYGRSGGSPTIEGVHRDGDDGLAWALDAWGGGPLWVLGQSLGAAVAIHAVAVSPAKDRIGLLVADSGFAGYRRIVRDKVAATVVLWPFQAPLAWGVDDRFSPERWISRVRPVPVLILHGTRDRVVPVSHARRLYELALEPKGLWLVAGAGHLGALADPDLRSRLLGWLDENLGP